jgi:ribonuclease P protein component
MFMAGSAPENAAAAQTSDVRRTRPARLPNRSDFQRLTASRRKVSTPGFLLQAAPAPTSVVVPPLRVGFTASRKVGNAVERNRARRRLRALVSAILPDAARPDWDYVLVARREILHRDFMTMGEELRGALRRLKARRDQAEQANDQ